MAVRMEYDDSPGVHTRYRQNSATIQQVISEKQVSLTHKLKINLYSTALRDKKDLDAKLFPLIISMVEERGDERFEDFYSFDNHGVCLSHSHSKYEFERKVVDEKHDQDVQRLKDNRALIRDMLYGYATPAPMCFHPTIIALRDDGL